MSPDNLSLVCYPASIADVTHLDDTDLSHIQDIHNNDSHDNLSTIDHIPDIANLNDFQEPSSNLPASEQPDQQTPASPTTELDIELMSAVSYLHPKVLSLRSLKLLPTEIIDSVMDDLHRIHLMVSLHCCAPYSSQLNHAQIMIELAGMNDVVDKFTHNLTPTWPSVKAKDEIISATTNTHSRVLDLTSLKSIQVALTNKIREDHGKLLHRVETYLET